MSAWFILERGRRLRGQLSSLTSIGFRLSISESLMRRPVNGLVEKMILGVTSISVVGVAIAQAVGEGIGVGVAWMAICVCSTSTEIAVGLFCRVIAGVIIGGLLCGRDIAQKRIEPPTISSMISPQFRQENCPSFPIRMILSRRIILPASKNSLKRQLIANL